MGQPVVHFEIMGQDGPALQAFYARLFGWRINADNPSGYGTIEREDVLAPDGSGIGGGIGQAPSGYEGHVTFYVGVPDVEAALLRAEELGGTRLMGPEQIVEGVVIGLFRDPEGHPVGLFRLAS